MGVSNLADAVDAHVEAARLAAGSVVNAGGVLDHQRRVDGPTGKGTGRRAFVRQRNPIV